MRAVISASGPPSLRRHPWRLVRSRLIPAISLVSPTSTGSVCAASFAASSSPRARSSRPCGAWVWMTAAPARPHGHSGGRVEEHLCGPAPRIGQDVELGGETALVRPISRRPASTRWSARRLEAVRWTCRSRPASGCSRPVPRRPAPGAFARTRSCDSGDTSAVRGSCASRRQTAHRAFAEGRD